MPLRSRISPRTDGMRTVTCVRLAILFFHSLPRATCSHQSFPTRTPMPSNMAMARKKMRHSTRAPRRSCWNIEGISAFHQAALGLRVVARERGEIIKEKENQRRKKGRNQPRAANSPPDLFIENELHRLAPNRDHEILGQHDERGANAGEQAVNFPASTLKQRSESTHDLSLIHISEPTRLLS